MDSCGKPHADVHAKRKIKRGSSINNSLYHSF